MLIACGFFVKSRRSDSLFVVWYGVLFIWCLAVCSRSDSFFWCRKGVNQCTFWLCLLKQMTQGHNNSVYSLWLFCIQVCNNTSDRKHADTTLENYVTETVMSIVTTFFSSPFSDQSTSLQVNDQNTVVYTEILITYLHMLSICCFQMSVSVQFWFTTFSFYGGLISSK